MALPSGIFTSPASGRLRVIFEGRWLADGVQPSDYTHNILLRAVLDDGAGLRRVALLSAENATCLMEVPYAAGTFISVWMELVDWSISAAPAVPPVEHTVQARDLRITCELLAAPAPGTGPVTFSGLLAQLNARVGPMAATPQQPRWEPDTDSGTQWFVRPLAAMATHEILLDGRITALDTSAPDYDPLDPGTWTTFCNHPLAPPGFGSIRVRDRNPIDPESIIATGYANKSFGGVGVAVPAEVRTDTTSTPGTTLYYIHVSGCPGSIDPVDGQFKGSVRLSWRYADLDVLDGASYTTAWPGLAAVDWTGIGAGDSLWVCGEYTDETLRVQRSGTAGAYLKVRLDYAGDPGRILQGRRITTPWTFDAATEEWSTDMPDVTDCALYAGTLRLTGVNTRSRTRVQVQHATIDYGANTIFFGSIRNIQTGMEVVIGSDFDTRNLPPGLMPRTRYFAIVVSSNFQFYSVSNAQYTIKLAASYADALAGIAVDIEPFPVAPPNTFFLLWVRQFDYPFFDQRPGELDGGEYCVDPIAGKLYLRWFAPAADPTSLDLRLSSESYSGIGACILGDGVSYIRVLGGGEYGGLFADTPPPAGFCGLAHQNIIEFSNGAHIVVDGLELRGGRSGVTYINVAFGTVRNCRIHDVAHHASGAEDLITVEPDLLLERNWISEVGQGHDFGDAQALVTNPLCHRTVFRRNFVQRLGRNTKVTHPVGAVFDSSNDMTVYRNWFDDSHGHAIELGSGKDEAGCSGAVVACNVVTRIGNGYDPATNLVQRVGGVHCTLNQSTDPGVWDADVFGNLFAFSIIGNRAPDTLDECGLVYMRTNANTGFGRCEIRTFARNAIFNCNGPVFSLQQNTNSTVTPTIASDLNLYGTTAEFAQRVSSDVVLRTVVIGPTYDGAHVVGPVAGYWSFDTGNDASSAFVPQDLPDGPAEPTLEQLEFLRRFDAYDTMNQPTIAVVGAFPFG